MREATKTGRGEDTCVRSGVVGSARVNHPVSDRGRGGQSHGAKRVSKRLLIPLAGPRGPRGGHELRWVRRRLKLVLRASVRGQRS